MSSVLKPARILAFELPYQSVFCIPPFYHHYHHKKEKNKHSVKEGSVLHSSWLRFPWKAIVCHCWSFWLGIMSWNDSSPFNTSPRYCWNGPETSRCSESMKTNNSPLQVKCRKAAFKTNTYFLHYSQWLLQESVQGPKS